MELEANFIFVLVALGALAVVAFLREVASNPSFVYAGLTIYSAVSKQLSVLYLERYPTFISESGTYSFNNGASLRFLAFNATIFIAAALTGRYLDRLFLPDKSAHQHMAPPAARDSRISIVLIGFVLALQMANLALSSGLPLPGASITRWTYWEEAAAFPILSELFGKLMAFCPLTLAIVCFSASRLGRVYDRNLAWGLFAIYLLFLFLTGQRFHGFLWPYVLFSGTYLIFRIAEGRSVIVSRFAVISVAVLIALLGYGVLAMAERGISVLAGGAVAALFYRVLILQGHTYWNMDVNVSDFGASWDFASLMNGMETIILTVGNPSLIETYLDQEINFAAGLPAITIYVFGFLGSIPVCAAYGVLLGAASYLLLWIIRNGRVLLAFPASYLWLWIHSAYGHASFEAILTPKFAVFALMTSIALAIPKKSANFSPQTEGFADLRTTLVPPVRR